MRTLTHVVAIVALMSFVTGPARSDDKKGIDKAKLVGTWKVTKAEGIPDGTLVELTKDGKVIMTIEMDGNKIKLEGTYKVEGDKLHSKIKVGDEEMDDTDTIKSLTDDKLVLTTKNGEQQEFEKVKKK